MDKLDFGQKIQELRKAKGLTQAKLAELVDMHEKHISRIESGKYLPNFDNLIKILNVLNVDIEKITQNEKLNTIKSPVKSRILKLINNADEKELKFYLGIIEQSQKGLKLFKN